MKIKPCLRRLILLYQPRLQLRPIALRVPIYLRCVEPTPIIRRAGTLSIRLPNRLLKRLLKKLPRRRHMEPLNCPKCSRPRSIRMVPLSQGRTPGKNRHPNRMPRLWPMGRWSRTNLPRNPILRRNRNQGQPTKPNPVIHLTMQISMEKIKPRIPHLERKPRPFCTPMTGQSPATMM